MTDSLTSMLDPAGVAGCGASRGGCGGRTSEKGGDTGDALPEREASRIYCVRPEMSITISSSASTSEGGDTGAGLLSTSSTVDRAVVNIPGLLASGGGSGGGGG